MTKKKPTKRRGQRSASLVSPTSTPSHTPPLSPPASSPRRAAERPQLPRLLTVDEVADLLRTTRKAVYALISKGALPGVVRLSRRLLIDQADVVEWLHEKRGLSLTTKGVQR